MLVFLLHSTLATTYHAREANCWKTHTPTFDLCQLIGRKAHVRFAADSCVLLLMINPLLHFNFGGRANIIMRLAIAQALQHQVGFLLHQWGPKWSSVMVHKERFDEFDLRRRVLSES